MISDSIQQFYGLNILYLLDNPDSQEPIGYDLQTYGLNVYKADGARQACDLFSHEHIDIIVADVLSAHESAFRLITLMRKKGFSTPVIIITACTDQDCFLKAIDLNVVQYLIKPFEKACLLRALQKAAVNLDKQHVSIRLNHHYIYHRKKGLLYRQDAEVVLSKKESLLLDLLCKTPHQVVQYEIIGDYVWGEDETPMTIAALRTMVRNIRKKTSSRLIKTMIGLGYKV